MKIIKIIGLLLITISCKMASAQDDPAEITAISKDDSAQLSTFLTVNNVNACYGNYSMLSQAIRYNASKCFALLVEKGADVNKVCNGYVSPLMHAAKYGRLDMIKVLVAKGANIDFKYSGEYIAANGETPLTYAEKYKQTAVADYLRSLKNKN
ncbi:ankyrin repeat domain-containing protein [Mucilaginibacter sp.]|uniref:ankyrin repeat domain-containing protein n=1 Tax=Mucilaginibacter sp. TaxID=1882438 RepID=UPI003267B592